MGSYELNSGRSMPSNNDSSHDIIEIQSDLMLNVSVFCPSSISEETMALNRKLQKIEGEGPKWYEVGPEKYRHMRKEGLTPLPGAILLPSASSYSIPSRDLDRHIPCRVLKPPHSSARGIFLHMHGGGWVLNDEESSDPYLQTIADACGLVCISVGYRLAPEHPFPAGPNDCFDAAEWLLNNGMNEFGQELSFIGGESAGANLALLSALGLLRSSTTKNRAETSLKGLLLHYGAYSLQWQPGTKHFKKDPTLVLDEESLSRFRDAYLSRVDSSSTTTTSPEVSPFYADLSGLQLPPALITCGTEDCLVEDSVFMATRWMMVGGHAILKLYPGSPHGFILFSPQLHENTRLALNAIKYFVDKVFS